jgi:hypothetical protein
MWAGSPHLVTARHCVEQAEKLGSEVLVRMTKTGGGVGFLPIPVSEWYFPDDESMDVAVVPWRPLPGHEYVSIPAAMMATSHDIYEYGIGVGDDLIITGLFTGHKGERQNLPVVRMGTIAAMPSEPIIDPDSGKAFRAYIAEVRSIGGLSGSPVYVRVHDRSPGDLRPRRKAVEFFLLGLVRSRWKYEGAITMPREFVAESDELRRLNMGLMPVEPADGIREVMEKEEVVKKRREQEKQERRSTGVSLEDLSAEDLEPDEFGRFEGLTRKLVNTPKSEVDELRKREDS